MDIDTAKSYATKENLIKALDKFGLMNARPIIVCNSKGRWTAIFGLKLSDIDQPFAIASLGFIVIN